MNLLAHLHLGNDLAPESAAGNLTADFCRVPGNAAFQIGVDRHRHIDQFTDSHEIVRRARRLFPPACSRFSPILIDLVFDLCLARTWERQSISVTCNEYIFSQFQSINRIQDELPKQASEILSIIQMEGWLKQYQSVEGLTHTVDRMIKRKPRLAPMRQGLEVLPEKYDAFEACFIDFYPELIASITPDQVDPPLLQYSNSANA